MLRTLLLILSLLLVAPATAQDAAEEAFLPVQKAFTLLRQSLLNRGGITDADLPAIATVCTTAASYNDAWPGRIEGLAIELQLSIWLRDDEQVDRLFKAMVDADQSTSEYGLAWARYHRQDDPERSAEIIQSLRRDRPGDPEIGMAWALHLQATNQFEAALSALDDLDEQRRGELDVAKMISDCHFAQNRFEEAVAALESIEDTALAADPVMRFQIERLLPQRREAMGLWHDELALRADEETRDNLPRVEIITPRGRIEVELFEDNAPNTVANFIHLVQQSFYDGTTFHRVIPNFMAQGGDPNSRTGEGSPGSGGPGWTIRDEHGGENIRRHFAGTLSMAKTPPPDTAGSQFFLTHAPTPHLNGQHTAFGRILEGLDVARAIRKDDVIITARVVRMRDHEYLPEKIGEQAAPLLPDPGTP